MKKKLQFFALILLLAVVSCKKDEIVMPAKGDYFISFKADGVQKEYKKEGFATISHSDTSGIFIDFMGAYEKAIGVDQPQFSFILFSRTSFFATSVYQDPLKAVSIGGVKHPQVHITYIEEAGTDGYLSLGGFTELIGPGRLWEHTVADAKTSITEITATYIKGTFSATVFKSTDITKKRVISDGKFYLPKF
ncbi:MAG: hypothetical protein ABI760_00375 [Ferruginibacter sp.]